MFTKNNHSKKPVKTGDLLAATANETSSRKCNLVYNALLTSCEEIKSQNEHWLIGVKTLRIGLKVVPKHGFPLDVASSVNSKSVRFRCGEICTE